MDIELANKMAQDKILEEDIRLKEQKNINGNHINFNANEENANSNKDQKHPIQSEHDEKKPLEASSSLSANFNEKTLKYFQDLVIYHKIKKRKVFLEKKVKTWVIVIYYLVSSFTNIISVLIFIIDSQIGENNSTKNSLVIIDFSIAIFFTLEFIQSFLVSEKKMNFLIRFDSIIDIITIIPSYINFLVDSMKGLRLSFMRIFRVLRVLRVLRLLKYVKMLKSDDDNEMDNSNSSGFRINKVKKQIIKFIVSLVSTIFVSAGIVTILQTYAPGSFNVNNLTFIDAVYFVIVTSSTLGYGDIVPTNTISRMLVIFLLIFLIYFFSEQIASIVSLLRISDNTEVSFDFERHNIIIGDLSAEGIKSFLDEFYDIYNFHVKLKNKPYTIIMLDEKNSKIKDNLSLEPYENKVQFLVTKTYSIEAFMKSNFEEADTIICINQNYKSNPWITDKINDFTLKNIKDFNKSNSANLDKKKLYLQSLILKEKIESKRLTPLLNIQILKLKSCLIAKSIYCKGYLTFITNLASKNIPQVNVKNEFLNDYIKGTENSLVIVNLPKKFRDIEFGLLFREIFFKSVNKYPNALNNENQQDAQIPMNPNTNYMNSIPSREDEKKFLDMQRSKMTNIEREKVEEIKHISGLILFGILQQKFSEDKIKEYETQLKEALKDSMEKEFGNNVEKVIYNPPSNYKISENDVGIFLTSLSKEEIEKLLDSIDPPNEIERKGTIVSISKNNDNILKHLKQVAKENYKKNITYITKQHSKLKFLEPTSRFIEADLFTSNISNQITIFGFPSYIEDIISKIRSQNLSNPILILAENYEEELKQKILKKFSNLYLVLGDFLDLKTLENVKTENSSFIIILSTENINTINEDSNAVLAARIIEQYFQIPYIVEVFDNVNSRFLGSLPFLNDNLADEMSEFIYPNYMQGKIFFTSFLEKLLPRSFNSLQEVICLQELIENDFKSEEEVYENEDNHDDLEIKLYTKTIYNFFSIKVPPHLEGKPYYQLFDELTSLKEVHIPLGIYGIKSKKNNDKDSNKVIEKCDKCRKCQECKNDELLCNKCKNCQNCNNYQDLDRNYLLNKYLNIINNEIKNNVLEYVYIENITTPLFITNPPIDFILEKDMEVLVFAKYNKMIDNDYTGEKQNFKKVSKFDKISEDIMNFSQKKDIVKKFEKYLHKRINQIELQNFE